MSWPLTVSAPPLLKIEEVRIDRKILVHREGRAGVIDREAARSMIVGNALIRPVPPLWKTRFRFVTGELTVSDPPLETNPPVASDKLVTTSGRHLKCQWICRCLSEPRGAHHSPLTPELLFAVSVPDPCKVKPTADVALNPPLRGKCSAAVQGHNRTAACRHILSVQAGVIAGAGRTVGRRTRVTRNTQEDYTEFHPDRFRTNR